MKKIFLACMMALFTMTASAQFYVGGSLGLSTSKTKIVDESATTTAFELAPEFGFNFNDYWAVGATLGIGHAGMEIENLNSFNILPYVRGTFAHTGIVDFFLEGAIGYQFIGFDKSDEKMNGFSLGIRPGILVKICPKCHLVARMSLLDYSYAKNDMVDFSVTGFAIGKEFSIGAVYNF